MPPDTRYFKKADETIDQYNTRVTSFQTPITSSSIAPTTPLNIQQPETAPLTGLNPKDPQIAEIEAQYAPTEQDKQQSLTMQRAAKLTGETSASAQEARRAELELDPVYQQKKSLAQSLSRQLQQTIDNDRQIQNDMQSWARGKEVTASGIQSLTMDQRRANESEAYKIKALLSASNDDLSSAVAHIDNALKAEFGAKKSELEALQANIDAYKNDPIRTKEELKRAAIAQVKLDARKATETKLEADRTTIQGLALQAQQNGAPAPILSALMKAKTFEEALIAGQGWMGKETAQSIQEYNFAVKGGYKGSYSQYQNEDANRKAQVARAGVANGEFGLSQGQANLFNNIVTKYNASPLIAAADRTVVLKNSIAQARANPSDGATQLNLVYSYIQALDTYQSAVREGELGLVNSIDSKIGKLSNYVEQVNNGQIIRPEVAKEIANAAENLVNTINEGAKSKEKSYASQANTLGLGEPWKKYQSGFTSSFNQPSNTGSAPVDLKSWISQPNYDVDIAKAKEAIANGADPVQVKARLQTKYKDVQL